MQQQPPDRRLEGSSEPAAASGHHDYNLSAPMLRFDLRSETEQLRQQESYRRGSPTGRTLVKEPDLRIVLMALKAGARQEEHRASGPISVHALQGVLRLRLQKSSVELTAGQVLMLEPGISHDVGAVEDAIFLLTIARTTYQDVSDRHESRD
jgi:quercetin dioxygenase-like cupin family protein